MATYNQCLSDANRVIVTPDSNSAPIPTVQGLEARTIMAQARQMTVMPWAGTLFGWLVILIALMIIYRRTSTRIAQATSQAFLAAVATSVALIISGWVGLLLACSKWNMATTRRRSN